ncbi:MAG: transporter substrate-binding domain-containing protein [bacterium]|nr:transporter substrate-binding domain-containing protein [bacterium]
MNPNSRSPLRRIARLPVVLLALLLVVLGCNGAGSILGTDAANREALHDIIDRGTLRVGTSGTQPPLTMKNQRGDLIGLDIELAQALADAMQVDLELVETPFAELLPNLEAGRIDLVISSLTITPARNARVAFAGPYMISGSSLLSRADLVDSLADASAMNAAERSWAALRGSTGEALILDLFPLATYIPLEDAGAAVAQISSGEIDGLFADVPFVQFQLARHPGLGLASLPAPFTTEPLGVALPPNSPLFANLVQNYLNTLEYTGELMQLKMHWMSAGDWLSEMP